MRLFQFLVLLFVVLVTVSVSVSALDNGLEFSLDMADKYVHFSGAAYCAHPRFKKEQVENW